MLQLAPDRKLTQLIEQIRCDDSDARAGSAQKVNFAGSNSPAADDQDWPTAQLQEDWEVVHARSGAFQACAAT